MCDIFFLGSDQLTQMYKLLDKYFSLQAGSEVPSTARGRNCCRSKPRELQDHCPGNVCVSTNNLMRTKMKCLVTLLDQTDQEPVTMAIAMVRDQRSKSTIARHSPTYSQKRTHGQSWSLHAETRTHNRTIRVTERPLVPHLVNVFMDDHMIPTWIARNSPGVESQPAHTLDVATLRSDCPERYRSDM